MDKYNKDKLLDLHFKGFTLIELMIVMVIITLMFSAGYANYRRSVQRQSVKIAAKQIEADIKYAQNQAFSGVKPEGCTLLYGYLFSVNQTNDNYTIKANCKNLDYDIGKTQVEVGEGLDIRISGTSAVVFKSAGHGLDFNNGNNDDLADSIVITIELGNTNVEAQVSLKGTGEVSTSIP